MSEKELPPLEFGDLVEAVPPYALACGSGVYRNAIVVSVDPLVLVSQGGDMLWRATVTRAKVSKLGKASFGNIAIATQRYFSETKPKESINGQG